MSGRTLHSPWPDASDFSGFIIVRLAAGFFKPDCGSLGTLAEELRLSGLTSVLDAYQLDRSGPLIKGVKPEKVLELELEAEGSLYPPMRSLTSYWRVDARGLDDRTDAVNGLNRLCEVDRAYEELAVSDPQTNVAAENYTELQGYLDPARKGIDARWAWDQPDGDGAKVTLVDVEQAWFAAHKEFAGKNVDVIHGENRDGIDLVTGDHGAAVLGIIIAGQNGFGVDGIAHGVTTIKLASRYDPIDGLDLHVASAIVKAIPETEPGDVLLLQTELAPGWPVEMDDGDFDAIRLASAHARIVIEPAGNKGTGLDDHDVFGIVNRNDPVFRESGAIMVAAAKSIEPHNRISDSNHGSRIDCYAWGADIVTCGGGGNLSNGDGDVNISYTNTFGDTSGAAAIIAGAALILQGKYQTTGSRLSPGQMRALLADRETGTLPETLEGELIGVMPNLRKLLEKLELVPDVYLRDNVGDTGVIPSSGPLSTSPDIIVRPFKEANPQSSFGYGSGTENSMILGYEVVAGQDNFVYVRMKNRGMEHAVHTTATIYWSKVSTLPEPGSWLPIGTTAPVTVPQGDLLVVPDPLTWRSVDIPEAGHYCFMAVLNDPSAEVQNVPSDAGPPLPPGPPLFDFDGFRAFVRSHNNVTWRNFNVIDTIAAGESAMLPLIFNGGPDQVRLFDLEIIQRLPANARVQLDAPLELAMELNADRLWKMDVDEEKDLARLWLPAQPRLLIRNVALGGKIRHHARFRVEGAEGMKRGGHSIAVRQLYKDEEIGRVTWQTHPRRKGKHSLE